MTPEGAQAQLYERPFLDSCVYISWVMGEVIATVDRGAIVQHIFTQATDKAFEIWISGPVVAEVHRHRGRVKLGSAEDESLIAFFVKRPFFQWVVADMHIGIHANRLCQAHNINPFDALHLACALRAKCDVFLTWDDDLCKIQIPDIRIEAPQIVGQTKMPI